MTNRDIREIIEKRKKALADACNITREELIQSTREIRERCRMTGRKFRPREVLLANRFLADMAGYIVQRTELSKAEEKRELEFGNLPMPASTESGKARKPN